MYRIRGSSTPLFLILPNRVVHVLEFGNGSIGTELILIVSVLISPLA
jgi:hypothetical protein